MPFVTSRESFDFVPLGHGLVQTEADIIYYDDVEKQRYTVRNGFVSDLASLPRFVRPFIDRLGSSMRPAVLHDYLYRDRPCSKATADRIYREALIEDGEPFLSAWAQWAGLALGGWWGWFK